MKDRILIIDDEELIRWSLKTSLEKIGYEVLEADSGEAGLKILKRKHINLVMLDMVLPGKNGLDILKEINVIDGRIQVIMITAFGSIKTAVEAVKGGAYDYMAKPFNLDEVALKVKRALKNSGVTKELETFRKIQNKRFSNYKIIYKSQIMQQIMENIYKICEANVDVVLITGETGVGKGLLARTIHRLGPNAMGPFITLNCAAIPDNLLESELFGHAKGAFTDAKGEKEGVVEEAIGGTLFLDEIGDMPHKLQGKLLRFIEEKRIRRVGGRREIDVNVKLIAATNLELETAIQTGEFRPDLYHRLNLIHIYLPPLRERKDDIIPLSKFFLNKFNLKYNRNVKGFTDKALDMFENYAWPGNIRELSNIIERFCILEKTSMIDSCQIITNLITKPVLSKNRITEIDLHDKNVSFDSLLNDFKKHLLKTALEECNYNKTNASKLLLMDRSTFQYQLKMTKLE